MKLITLFIFTIIILAADVFAANVCDQSYANQPEPTIVHKKDCTLEWKTQGQTQAAQVIFLKKGCRKIEGADAQDCFIARTCPSNPKDDKFSSMPLMDDPANLDGYCKTNKPELRVVLGAEDEFPRSPVKATINCKGSKAIAITLKSPTNKTLVCPLH